MAKVISREEAIKWIDKSSDYIDKYNLREFYTEALEDNNVILVMSSGLTIVYKDSSIADDVIGFYMHPIYNHIHVWFAIEDVRGISDDKFLLDCCSDTSYKDIIAKCKAETHKCPVCGKSVIYSEQQRYSFAGRCCKECLPKMQKEYEYPGWYN